MKNLKFQIKLNKSTVAKDLRNKITEAFTLKWPYNIFNPVYKIGDPGVNGRKTSSTQLAKGRDANQLIHALAVACQSL